MLETLRQRNFSWVWFAGLISLIGDRVFMTGLSLYVYRLTGSALSIGAMMVVGILPGLLFGSVAGVFVDRWDRRRTMIVVNLLLAASLLPLLAVRSVAEVWIIYGVLFVASTLTQFFVPAEQAILPLLVDAEHLPGANALSALNNNLSRLLGPSLGGIIVVVAGIAGITLVDTSTFLVAAGMILMVSGQYKAAGAAQVAGPGLRGALGKVRDELRDGLRYIRGRPLLARLLAIVSIAFIGEGFMATLFVPFVLRVLGGTETDYGYMLAAQAIGGIIGSLLVGATAKRVSPRMLMAVTSILFGLGDLALFYYPLLLKAIWPGMVLIALVGLPGVGVGTGMMTLFQLWTEDEYRGRVFGVYGTLASLLMAAGAGVSGLLSELVPIIALLTVQGAGFVVVGVLAIILLRSPAGEVVTLPIAPELSEV